MSKTHVGAPSFAVYKKMIGLKRLPDALLKQVVIKRRGESRGKPGLLTARVLSSCSWHQEILVVPF